MTADPYAPPKAQVADAESSSQQTTANPHVLWRQLLGLVVWITVLSLPAGGPIALLLALALGGAIFADAWVSGIYKRPGVKSMLNISPMSWGVLAVALYILAFPIYMLYRNRLRTRQRTNGFFIAAVIMGTLVFIFVVANILLTPTGQPR